MPTTPNYGWITPVVAGDLGAWGGILNTAIAEIDADLFAGLAVKANLAGGNTFSGPQTFTGAVQTPSVLRVGGAQSPGNLGAAVVVQGAVAATASGMEFWSGGVQRGYVYGSSAAVELFAGGGLGLTLTGSGGIVMNGNTTLSGSLGASGNLTGGVRVVGGVAGPSNGRVALTPSGLSTNTGYVEFLRPDGTRNGYIGFGSTAGGADTGEIFYVAGSHNFSSGNVLVGGSVSASSVLVGGSVSASSFSGSGAGLTNVPWGSLTGVPSTFTPSAHTHVIADVTGLQTALNGKSNVGHTHVISDVTGLQSALDGKSNVGHTHAWADVTKPAPTTVDVAPSGFSPIITDFNAQPPGTQDTLVLDLQTRVNALIAMNAQLRTALITAGLAV